MHHYVTFILRTCRQFLESGPPANKTILHFLNHSTSYYYQLYYAYIIIFNFMVIFFKDFLLEGIKENSYLHCHLLTPRYIIIPMSWNILMISLLWLMKTFAPIKFLELDHERLNAHSHRISMLVLSLSLAGRIFYSKEVCVASEVRLFLNNKLDQEFKLPLSMVDFWIMLILIILLILSAVALILWHLASSCGILGSNVVFPDLSSLVPRTFSKAPTLLGINCKEIN